MVANADSFQTPLRVEYLDGEQWRLLEPFAYVHPTAGVITVPAGFETDFASIPRALWAIYPPTGKWGKAAVVHDYLYHLGSLTRKECDQIFLQGMKDLGVPRARRTLMYWAVRVGGGGPWEKHRRNRVERILALKAKMAVKYGKKDR